MGQPAHHCSSPAGQSQPSPPPPPCRLPPLASGQEGVCPRHARVRPSHLLPGCLRPRRPGRLHASPRIPDLSLSLTPTAPPLLWLPLPLFPSAPEGAAVLYHGHRPPHASPTRQEAPPRSPLPPHQGGGRRKPCDAANIIFFLAGRRRSSLPPQLLRTVSELTDLPVRLAVSLRPCPSLSSSP